MEGIVQFTAKMIGKDGRGCRRWKALYHYSYDDRQGREGRQEEEGTVPLQLR